MLESSANTELLLPLNNDRSAATDTEKKKINKNNGEDEAGKLSGKYFFSFFYAVRSNKFQTEARVMELVHQ